MTTAAASLPTTNGIIARLEASGLPVGRSRMPDTGAGWEERAKDDPANFKAYLVLHPLTFSRQGPDAPISDRGLAPVSRFQVTAVGASAEQAEAAADMANGALQAMAIPVAGHTQVCLVHELNVGPVPDEDVSPPVFTSFDRWRLDL